MARELSLISQQSLTNWALSGIKFNVRLSYLLNRQKSVFDARPAITPGNETDNVILTRTVRHESNRPNPDNEERRYSHLHPDLKQQNPADNQQPLTRVVAGYCRAVITPVFCAFLASLVLLTVLSSVPLGQARAQQNLPSMGEPADASLSPRAERQLGEQFMRQVRASVPIIRDAQLAEYMQSLGERLASNVAQPGQHEFEFFMINNGNINAFAIPGGFIGINAGLIDAMQIEDQLAAVVGHEIAHITQRHHARAVQSSSRSRLTTAAAILAAIIIGQSNPQAGQAALAAGLAASQQSVINFTRSNEYEADRIGIEILSNANYNTAAMAEAFEILRRKNSINTSSLQLEYLRTHPLDNTRIAEAKNRASSSKGSGRYSPNIDFSIFKARLAVMTTRDRTLTERNFKARLTTGNEPTKIGAAYALALLSTQQQHNAEARQYLDSLEGRHDDNLFVQLLTAELLFNEGRRAEAAELLGLLTSIYPESFAVVQMQFEQLIDSSRLSEARQRMLEYIRSTAKPDNIAWRELANIEQRLGNESASHEALANYFSNLNNSFRAREQLQLAIRNVRKGSNDELRIKARLREFKEE